MRSITLLHKIAFCFVITMLLPPAALPQASTATVSGTVRDQTSAVIPNATVTLTNRNTNTVSKTTTNTVGFYLFAGVLPGPYLLTAETPGMQKFEGDLVVQVAQTATVDVTMHVGQTATEVAVQDVTPLLQTSAPALGHVLERARMEQLPINGRQLTTLLQTVPGMEGTRAYGLRDGSYEISLDGSSLIDRNYGGVFRRQPGLDAVQEFKVENNASSAKYSRPTSLILSTKSGTNTLHGSLFETNRNNGYGLARSRTDTYTKAPFLNRNEFGASAGGPVYIPKIYNGKDKTFWFFAYEGLRNISPANQLWPVPSDAMRNGDFHDLVDSQGHLNVLYDPWSTNTQTWARTPYPNNVIPQNRESPLAKFLLGITPQPTLPNINPNLDYNWQGAVPGWQRNWTITTRVDHRFSDRDQFYGRYTQGNYTNFSQFYSQPMLNNVPGTNQSLAPNKALALSYVHTFFPTLFNEFLVSGSREVWFKGTGDPSVKYASQMGLSNPLNVAGWPGLYGNMLYNGNYYFETDNSQASPEFYAILDDNVTKIKGRHELQFGFHFRYDQLNLLPDQQQIAGNNSWSSNATCLYDTTTSRTQPACTPYTGDDMGNFYLGLMNYSNQFARGYFYMRSKEYALYFHDNFRLNSRLTLSLGLRWEYWPPYDEKNHLLVSFDRANHAIVLGQSLDTMYKLQATVPAIVNRLTALGAKFESYQEAGLPQTLMYGNRADFGPRAGFAYRAGDGSKSFVVRGGYTMSYFHIPARPFNARMRSNAPLNARFRTSLTDASLTPDGIANYGMRSVPTVIAGQNSQNAVTLDTVSGLNRGSAGVAYFDPHQPDGRVQNWNFTVEKEVARDTVVRAGYVGNHSDHLEQFYQYNSPTPAYVWYASTKTPLPTGEFASVATNFYDRQVYGSIEQYRMTGWGNYQGAQLELERRFSKGIGFQLFYVVGNNLAAGGQNWTGTSVIPEVNQFMPGLVPTDLDERNAFLNYQRDTTVPKHRVRWNWIVDLPFGKGKPVLGGAGPVLNRIVGGWQVAGLGSLASTYTALPTGIYPTGTPVEVYGYKYPIQDCTSGTCYPGYLWWNGYIPANRINSTDPVTGKPNGYMGIPAGYKPAASPLIPYPAVPNSSDPNFPYYGTNTVFIPLSNGVNQRTTYSDGLHPWRQQYISGPRQWNMDASLFKTIPITERLMVRFNLDAFNVLNHPGNPNSFAQTGILNVRTSGNSPRVLQMTLRVTW